MRAVSGSADHPHPQVSDLVERGDVQWLEAYIRAAGEVEQPGAIAQQDGRDDYQDGVEVASLQALASDVGAEHGDVAVTGRCLGRASVSTKESRKVTPGHGLGLRGVREHERRPVPVLPKAPSRSVPRCGSSPKRVRAPMSRAPVRRASSSASGFAPR